MKANTISQVLLIWTENKSEEDILTVNAFIDAIDNGNIKVAQRLLRQQINMEKK